MTRGPGNAVLPFIEGTRTIGSSCQLEPFRLNIALMRFRPLVVCCARLHCRPICKGGLAIRNMSATAPRTPPKRSFPPLYASSGSAAEDRLAFFHILERLKVRRQPREYLGESRSHLASLCKDAEKDRMGGSQRTTPGTIL